MNINQLLAALTTCMLTFSALEAGFYFIYNKMVFMLLILIPKLYNSHHYLVVSSMEQNCEWNEREGK